MPYEKGKRTLRYERYDKECPALTQNCATGDQKNMVAIPNSNGNVHSLDANYWKGSNNPNKSKGIEIMGSTQKHSAKMENISPSLTKAMGDGGGHIPMKIENMRIRRLTHNTQRHSNKEIKCKQY